MCVCMFDVKTCLCMETFPERGILSSLVLNFTQSWQTFGPQASPHMPLAWLSGMQEQIPLPASSLDVAILHAWRTWSTSH